MRSPHSSVYMSERVREIDRSIENGNELMTQHEGAQQRRGQGRPLHEIGVRPKKLEVDLVLGDLHLAEARVNPESWVPRWGSVVLV